VFSLTIFARRFKQRANAPFGYKTVLRVGLPLIAGMASATIMQFTDRLFLSRYSLEAISAALPAGSTAMVLQLALVGLCGYVSVFIAQYTGASRPEEVGAVLWQGIWLSLAGAVLLALSCFLAEPVFDWAGHDPAIRRQEVVYFQVLNAGGGFFLLNSVLSGFFVGRGVTRPVLLANLAGAALNIPLDYAFIFGFRMVPEMGIFGAALATVLGSVFTCCIFAAGIFRGKNETRFRSVSAWRIRRDLFRSLLRFGGPSGVNLFMEVVGFAWFILEVGKLGLAAPAASNLALSINQVIFTPMLGLNTAVAALVGQAMGRKKPDEAQAVTSSALHLSFLYMMPLALLFVLFAGPLMDLFRPDNAAADFAAVRAIGVVLLCYVAVYSLLDSFNIVYIGALKGAGDTLFIMLILGGAGTFFLILPVLALKHFGLASVHTLWWALTTYVMLMAVCVRARFQGSKWRAIRMIGG
jgi:MATE family multidrug resistance protein